MPSRLPAVVVAPMQLLGSIDQQHDVLPPILAVPLCLLVLLLLLLPRRLSLQRLRLLLLGWLGCGALEGMHMRRLAACRRLQSRLGRRQQLLLLRPLHAWQAVRSLSAQGRRHARLSGRLPAEPLLRVQGSVDASAAMQLGKKRWACADSVQLMPDPKFTQEDCQGAVRAGGGSTPVAGLRQGCAAGWSPGEQHPGW